MVLAATKRTQADEEQDNAEGLHSPISSAGGLGTRMPKFDSAHLFTGHEDTVIPVKQQAHGARQKDLGRG